MTPRQQLDEYCRRYGVSAEFAERLLPLVEKAEQAAPDTRRRILELVRVSFEKEAERCAGRRSRAGGGADDRILRTVAEVLHAWNPPEGREELPGGGGAPAG